MNNSNETPQSTITTQRLRLVAATPRLAQLELQDPPQFARELVGAVPDNWPPESIADVRELFLEWLLAAPQQVGWFGWYALVRGTRAESDCLIGSGGFKGPPQNFTAEVGYSVLPQFQGQGFATEMCRGLCEWACSHPEVQQVRAETEWANPPSVRVLEKAGFVRIGPTDDGQGERFERRCGGAICKR